MALPIVHDPSFVTSLPPDHRFPMGKFNTLYRTLRDSSDRDRLDVYDPLDDPVAWIRAVHDEDYFERFRSGGLTESEIRRIGLPWSEGLVDRTITAVGGTLRTIDLALDHGLACNTAGGTHHAFPDRGAGFCILNDLAVGAHYALRNTPVSSVLILDLDVHQGNGTAGAFRETASVVTVSFHCESNYPFERTPGDWDVELPAGQSDGDYLATLRETLPDILEAEAPDLVLYDAGVDVHRDDSLGKLNLTDAGLARRDQYVLEELTRRDLPVAGVIGGGYDEDLETLAERHAILHRTALSVLNPSAPQSLPVD